MVNYRAGHVAMTEGKDNFKRYSKYKTFMKGGCVE